MSSMGQRCNKESRSMRTSTYAVVLILSAAFFWSERALAFNSYSDSLTGSVVPAGSSTISVEADAAGDLPGRLIIAVNATGANVTGGSWWLVVQQRNADGSTSET